MNKLVFFLLFLMISFSQMSFAEERRNLPIDIISDQQEFDILKNIATFSGTVIITQGKTKIESNRAIVQSFPAEGKNPAYQQIELFGSPVKFNDILDNGKKIYGEAIYVKYTSNNELLELKDNAYVEQEGNKLRGDFITYNLNLKKVQATAKKGKRINSLIIPAQFNNKK